VWLAGLTLLSWLGRYPAPATHAGNLGLLTLGWAVLVFAAFSALVLWLAVARCLPGERMREHLADSSVAPAEPAT